MISSAGAGLVAGLTLIVAIGAQNAFVLRQGLLRRHVVAVVAVCALSDLALILVGVAGIGALVGRAPVVLVLTRWLGVGFLLGYAVLALRRAVVGGAHDRVEPTSTGGAVIATCLAFTWLNPHVYLDTVLLLGSLASTHGSTGRWWFGAGAGLASVLWFGALGFGARLLAPVFAHPRAWRLLDGLIAVTMIVLAVRVAIG